MPRKERLTEPGHYHIINRGVERRSVFIESEDYDYFLDLVIKIKAFGIVVHAFCLMGNHYHLLIETTQNNLPKAIQHLNDKYAKYFNKKYTRNGHLWQGRYKSYPLFDEAHFWIVVKYIERNPIKAGMIDYMDQYRYQSFYQWNCHYRYLSILNGSMIFDMTLSEYREYISSDLDNDAIDIVYASPKLIIKEGKYFLLKKRLETFFEYDKDIKRNDNIKKAYDYGYTKAEIAHLLKLNHSTVTRIVHNIRSL